MPHLVHLHQKAIESFTREALLIETVCSEGLGSDLDSIVHSLAPKGKQFGPIEPYLALLEQLLGLAKLNILCKVVAKGCESVLLPAQVALSLGLVLQVESLHSLLLVPVEACESFQHCLTIGVVLCLEALLTLED